MVNLSVHTFKMCLLDARNLHGQVCSFDQTSRSDFTVKFLKKKKKKKKWDTDSNNFVIYLSLKRKSLALHAVMHPKDADGIANSVDSDQTAPLGAV